MADKCDLLEVRVDGLDDDITEIKQDLKEIRQEIKKQNDFYQECITSLRENVIKITSLIERQDEKMEIQNEKMERQDRTLESIGKEVSYLRADVEANKNTNSNDSWFKSTLDNHYKWILVLLVLAFCVMAGIDVTKFFGIFPSK